MAGQVINESYATNAAEDLFEAKSTSSAEYHLDEITFIVYAINCAVNVALSFIATFGNLVVLRALRKTPTLHPPYKALLGGLALSDLAVGLITQPVFVAYAINSLCKQILQVESNSTIAIRILGILLSSVSLLTTTVISVDRILALRLKTRYRQVVTLTRVVLALIAVWLLGGVAATAIYFYEDQGHMIALGLLLFCITVTSFNYLNIYRAMRRHSARVFVIRVAEHPSVGGVGAAPDLMTARYKRSVSSALYVYVALLLCCLPYLCVGVVSLFVDWSTALVVCRHIGETVVYLNSSLNPLLYCCTSRDLRRAILTSLKIPCSVRS